MSTSPADVNKYASPRHRRKKADFGEEKKTSLPLSKIFVGAGLVLFMALMLIKPDYYLNSARRGLSLYATSVLPALFPFYFCSLLLTYIGAARTVSGIFKRPVRALFNAPKESAYVLILSMLSGYPVGASMTAELYDAGVITQKEAKAISAFASTSGPIFMLGTVGAAIFNDVRIGAIVLAAHYMAAILNGIIFRLRDTSPSSPTVSLMAANVDSLMSRTISSSTLNMLYVGGYIVLCGMLVDTIPLLGIDKLLLSALPEDAAMPIIAAMYGMIEMTRGVVASADCLPHLAVALSAGIISLGGLSVTLQNYTFLSRCKMKLGEIILRKSVQCFIAFFIAFGLSFLL